MAGKSHYRWQEFAFGNPASLGGGRLAGSMDLGDELVWTKEHWAAYLSQRSKTNNNLYNNSDLDL